MYVYDARFVHVQWVSDLLGHLPLYVCEYALTYIWDCCCRANMHKHLYKSFFAHTCSSQSIVAAGQMQMPTSIYATYIHAAYIHKYIHAYMHTYMHTDIHTHTYVPQTYIHTYIQHKRIHIHRHTSRVFEGAMSIVAAGPRR